VLIRITIPILELFNGIFIISVPIA